MQNRNVTNNLVITLSQKKLNLWKKNNNFYVKYSLKYDKKFKHIILQDMIYILFLIGKKSLGLV